MSMKKDRERITQLKKLVAHHQELYHAKDAPEISDEAYDSLVRELAQLEGSGGAHEVFAVGAAASEAFSKVPHTVRQWSFSNVFSYHELQEYEARLYRFLQAADITDAKLTYVAEHKIDGLKVVLEYAAGKLIRAATRGDGVVGEDVTHTVRTITDVPHTLSESVDVICVGEVWLSVDEFARINAQRKAVDEPLFANPRNAAAGSLRQLDASVAAKRKLSMYCYDLDAFNPLDTTVAVPATQKDELVLLKKLGLRVNEHYALCTTIADVESYYQTWVAKKDALPYGVDGVVVKVNDIVHQKALGYTAKSPRFGTAYKFPAEEATTVVEDIQLQVGRTGTITPVAHLTPVVIAGSTVSRATLHNEDEIARLDVRIGDTIILKKAGDIIPKVVSVLLELRPDHTTPYRFPKKVVGCGGDGSIERIPGEAAYRCVMLDSDFLHRQRLYHFVSKSALNIDGVGPRIIDLLMDNGVINTYHDLFELQEGDLKDLPSFQEKAAANVVHAINAARTVSLPRLLIGLSIDHVGEETARLIADHFGTLEAIAEATVAETAAIYGVGDTVAQSVVDWMSRSENKTTVRLLLPHLKLVEGQASKKDSILSGKTIVFTGTLTTLSRDEAKDLARSVQASVTSSVSKKTNYVVAGDAAGSKADKAKELGVTVISESDFIRMVDTAA